LYAHCDGVTGHRVANPLTAICGLTQTLMEMPDLDIETRSEMYHAIYTQCLELLHLSLEPRAISAEEGVLEMASHYPMSFAAVQKHVAVLERAGLVTKEPRGREQLVRTDAGAVARARQALDDLERTWRGRVDRMSAVLAPGTEPERKNSTIRGTG